MWGAYSAVTGRIGAAYSAITAFTGASTETTIPPPTTTPTTTPTIATTATTPTSTRWTNRSTKIKITYKVRVRQTVQYMTYDRSNDDDLKERIVNALYELPEQEQSAFITICDNAAARDQLVDIALKEGTDAMVQTIRQWAGALEAAKSSKQQGG